jgi:prepilin-type N-terminal cleavage/methylation domain-containing protein
MRHILKNSKGFSLAELLIVVALIGILATIVLVNFGSSDVKTKEAALQANVEALRTAIDLYRSDHGFFPGSQQDDGYPLTDAEFKEKLTYYSSNAGAVNTSKDDTYKYGPYLKEFPNEPFSNSDSLTWSLGTTRILSTIAASVAAGSGDGGWYYEPESGNVVANLGSDYPSEYAGF